MRGATVIRPANKALQRPRSRVRPLAGETQAARHAARRRTCALDRTHDDRRLSIRVGAYQSPLLPDGSLEAISLIAKQVRACEALGVEILCCPEAVLGGLGDYSGRPADLAIDVASGQLCRLLTPLASKMVTTIVGFTEAGPEGQLFNSAAVFSRCEVVGVYRKIHPAINRSVYKAGAATPIFNIGGLVFGIVICRDSTYPELASSMAARGATALFVPTNNALPPTKGGPGIVEDARRTDGSRATENRVSVIRADVAGRVNGVESYGSTEIVGPDGVVLRSAKPLEPDLLVADLEIDTVSAGRNRSNIQMEPTRAGA
jgi:predicted amidohydrolase